MSVVVMYGRPVLVKLSLALMWLRVLPWMGALVDIPQFLRGQVSINLRGRKRLMAKQLLNASQIGTVV